MSGSPPRRADVAVVGAGVAGLAAAYYVARQGREVLVIDRGEPGAETSWGNCGLITPSYCEPLTQTASLRYALRSLLDPGAPFRVAPTLDPARLGWFLGFARNCNRDHRDRARRGRWNLLHESRGLLDELIEQEQLACEWSPGGLTTLFLEERALAHQRAILELARAFGLEYEVWSGQEARRREPLIAARVAGAIHTPRDAHLEPGRFGKELARAASGRGVRIVAGLPVESLAADERRILGVRTSRGLVEARDVVMAAGPWAPALMRPLGIRLPLQPGKGYSITWDRPLDGLRTPLKLEETKVVATPWLSGFRLGSTMEFAGYDARLNPTRLARLVAGARPYLEHPLELGPGREWCGWRPMCVDELPILGPSTRLRGLHYACGHGQLGVSQCTASGRLVADLLTGADPLLDPKPYSPARFGL